MSDKESASKHVIAPYYADTNYNYIQFPDAIVPVNAINNIQCSLGTCIADSGTIRRIVYRDRDNQLYRDLNGTVVLDPHMPNPRVSERDFDEHKLPRVDGRYPAKIVCAGSRWHSSRGSDLCTITYGSVRPHEMPFSLTVTRDYFNRA